MRKLVVIAVLVSLLAGAVYAQELKFDGYLNSGLGFAVNDIKDDDPYFKAFGVDGESNGYRFRLNGSFTNESKNAGAKFRIQSQRNLSLGVFSLAYACGWVGFFENKITLTGGIIDDSTWQTADWWFNDDLAEGLGLLLKATPIDGLSLGFGVYTITQQTGGSNNIISTDSNLPNFGNIMPEYWEAKYTLYASYTMPDVFRIALSFRNKNKTMWRPVSTTTGNYTHTGDYEPCTVIGELRILAVKDLTAVVVGIFDNLDDFSNNGNIRLSETFGYKINSDLSMGLNAVQFLYSRPSGSSKDAAMLFGLWGQYALGSVVPRLDLVYFINGQSKMAYDNTNKQWERKGFAQKDKASVFSARPSVKINLDSRTFIEIGDMINYDFAETAVYGGKKSMLTNVAYVDFKISF